MVVNCTLYIWRTKGDVLNILSLVILTLGVSLLIATIVGTFNHEYDYTRRVIGGNFSEKPVSLSDIKHLRGNIIGFQIDKLK